MAEGTGDEVLRDRDLKVDVFSGGDGRSVAVRITHEPTGIAATARDHREEGEVPIERVREKARRILRDKVRKADT